MELIFPTVQKCIRSLSRTRTSTGFYQPAQKKKTNEGRLDAAGLPFWPLKVGLRLDILATSTLFLVPDSVLAGKWMQFLLL